MKAGVKIFGTVGVDAGSKELKQVHLRTMFEPLYPRTLRKEEYEEVLESHLFLKNKIDKTVKGRMVYGGNKQHGIIDKEDVTPSTAAL